MAKKSKIVKLQHQAALVTKFADQRQSLKDWPNCRAIAYRLEWHQRDHLDDGRSHGYLCKVEMSHLNFQKLALQGLILGVKKSSW